MNDNLILEILRACEDGVQGNHSKIIKASGQDIDNVNFNTVCSNGKYGGQSLTVEIGSNVVRVTAEDISDSFVSEFLPHPRVPDEHQGKLKNSS